MEPVQSVTFLGLVIDSNKKELSLPSQKVSEIKSQAQNLLKQHSVSKVAVQRGSEASVLSSISRSEDLELSLKVFWCFFWFLILFYNNHLLTIKLMIPLVLFCNLLYYIIFWDYYYY